MFHERKQNVKVRREPAPPTPVAVPPSEIDRLITELADWHPIARRAAAQALGQMGAQAAPAAKALVQAMVDKISHVRTAAGNALTDIGEAAVPSLMAALKDPFADLRARAAAVLRRMGPSAKGALKVLKSLADKDPDPAVKTAAKDAVERITATE